VNRADIATWRFVKIGEAFQTVTGNTPPKAESHLYGTAIPLVKPPELLGGETFAAADGLSEAGRKVSRVAPTGSVLVSCIGNLGKIGLAGTELAFNQQINAIMPNRTRADPKFVFYYCLSPIFVEQLESLSSGTTVSIVNKSRFNSIRMPLPPLEEQKRIVAVLDQAFAALARALTLAEANLADAEELIDAQIVSIFRTVEGGARKCLGDVCDFVRGPFGGSLKKSIFQPSGYAVYEQQHAIRNQFEDFRYFIGEAKLSEMKRFRVRAGDLIMSCSGTMGRVAIVPNEAPDGIINQALLKLRPKAVLSGEFLKHWMESDDFQNQLSENTMGVAIKNVASVKTLKTLSVALPNLETQDTIVSQIEEAQERVSRLKHAYGTLLKELGDLRQSLLQKAFAGELT
jgi:type I restriction enzyme S subunit